MITAYQIAKFIKGELVGKDVPVKGAIDLLPGKKTHISFLNSNLSKDCLDKTKSDLIIVSKEIASTNFNKTIIKVSNPKGSFFDIVQKLDCCSLKIFALVYLY